MSVRRPSVCPVQDKDWKVKKTKQKPSLILHAKTKSSNTLLPTLVVHCILQGITVKKICNQIQNTGHHTYKSSSIIKACAGLIPNSIYVNGTAGIMVRSKLYDYISPTSTTLALEILQQIFYKCFVGVEKLNWQQNKLERTDSNILPFED